jgi:hypothetical protein
MTTPLPPTKMVKGAPVHTNNEDGKLLVTNPTCSKKSMKEETNTPMNTYIHMNIYIYIYIYRYVLVVPLSYQGIYCGGEENRTGRHRDNGKSRW